MDNSNTLNQIRRLRKVRNGVVGLTFLLFIVFLIGRDLLYEEGTEIQLGDWFSIASISVFVTCALLGLWINNRAARLKP